MTYLNSVKAISSHWLLAACLYLTMFINLLDTTIVNLALPSIRQSLAASDQQIQWVLAVYVVCFAVGLLPFGRLGDGFGTRRLFLVGLGGFLFASVGCGMTVNADFLILFRAVKGFFAAMAVPQILAVIHATFPEQDKPKAISLFGAVAGLGAMSGPVIGGLILSENLFDLGWRLIFILMFRLPW